MHQVYFVKSIVLRRASSCKTLTKLCCLCEIQFCNLSRRVVTLITRDSIEMICLTDADEGERLNDGDGEMIF